MSSLSGTWKTIPELPAVLAGPNACLVQIYPTGQGLGVLHQLGQRPVVLGRDPNCDIWLSDPSISRRHARIHRIGDEVYITDLQSTNGTLVNEEPVTTHCLRNGDNVRLGGWILRFLAGNNMEATYHEELYRLTVTDGLTGIHNKRYFMELLERELGRARRHHRPLALAMLDVDHFKRINDELGHLGGDHALRELAEILRTGVRREDALARFGGEEFALLLPETTSAVAVQVAERLRQRVESMTLTFEGFSFHVTVSIGLAAASGSFLPSAERLIIEADERLYEAKRSGRNRVASQMPMA